MMNRWILRVLGTVGICVCVSGCATGRSAPTFDFAGERNPTTLAGRGTPSLDDRTSPAAWILVDGKFGTYKEREGNPLLQWFIDDPVSASPTFRVEAYKPLLGDPTDFSCALQMYDSPDGIALTYAIRAKEGTFRTGRVFSLLSPGSDFIVLDKITNEELSSIPPLPPGTYGLAAKVANSETGAEALAVTYFTVGWKKSGKASVAGSQY